MFIDHSTFHIGLRSTNVMKGKNKRNEKVILNSLRTHVVFDSDDIIITCYCFIYHHTHSFYCTLLLCSIMFLSYVLCNCYLIIIISRHRTIASYRK